MQEINVIFLHPTNGNSLEVSMDKSLPADAIINRPLAKIRKSDKIGA